MNNKMRAEISLNNGAEGLTRDLSVIIDSITSFEDCCIRDFFHENTDVLNSVGCRTKEKNINMDADSCYLGNLCLFFIRRNKEGYLKDCGCLNSVICGSRYDGCKLTIIYNGSAEIEFWRYLKKNSDIIKSIEIFKDNKRIFDW